jgi:hypothetical protein
VARRLAPLHRAGQLDRAPEQQQLLGERGLARVRVGDDGEGAAPGSAVGNLPENRGLSPVFCPRFSGYRFSASTRASSRPLGPG